MSQLEKLNKILEEEHDERKKAQASFIGEASLWEQIEIPAQLLKTHDLMREHGTIVLHGMDGRYKTLQALSKAVERLQFLRKEVLKVWQER